LVIEIKEAVIKQLELCIGDAFYASGIAGICHKPGDYWFGIGYNKYAPGKGEDDWWMSSPKKHTLSVGTFSGLNTSSVAIRSDTPLGLKDVAVFCLDETGAIRTDVTPLVKQDAITVVMAIVEETFYPLGGGVVLAWRDFPTSYTTIHNLTSGDHVAPSNYIGQLRDEYGWMIFRGFVIFDTRSLPADSKIISAVLQIYGARDESDTDFAVVVQKGSSGHPKTILSKADFYYGYYSGDGGRLSTIGFRVGAYNDIELNGDGISWIKKAGAPDITRLALRSSRDINFIAPYGSEMVEIPLGPTTYKPPRLVVTYQK
jgi:hypothetical protein